MRTAFHRAFNTELHAFKWISEHPKILNDFNTFMSFQRRNQTYWLDFFPFRERVLDLMLTTPSGLEREKEIFVDVGGALGSETSEIKRRYPDLPGKMILQDLPHTINRVSSNGSCEAVAHDFFTLQPVKGQILSVPQAMKA